MEIRGVEIEGAARNDVEIVPPEDRGVTLVEIAAVDDLR
jgi:hypothetical protein